MIARLYCSFRRNSHAPCLHPVIHLELPFPSLHCFPDSSVSCAPKPPSLRACSKSPRSHSVFISSGDDDYFRNFILFIRSKGCIAFLDHRWSGQDFGIFFFFFYLLFPSPSIYLCVLVLNNPRNCLGHALHWNPSKHIYRLPKILYIWNCLCEGKKTTIFKKSNSGHNQSQVKSLPQSHRGCLLKMQIPGFYIEPT